MNATNLKKYESALISRADEVRKELHNRERIAIEKSAEEMDGIVLAADREVSAQRLANYSNLLRLIEAARARIRDGTYGYCRLCEERIPEKRLEAIPWAILCVPCQTETERTVSAAGLARVA